MGLRLQTHASCPLSKSISENYLIGANEECFCHPTTSQTNWLPAVSMQSSHLSRSLSWQCCPILYLLCLLSNLTNPPYPTLTNAADPSFHSCPVLTLSSGTASLRVLVGLKGLTQIQTNSEQSQYNPSRPLGDDGFLVSTD